MVLIFRHFALSRTYLSRIWAYIRPGDPLAPLPHRHIVYYFLDSKEQAHRTGTGQLSSRLLNPLELCTSSCKSNGLDPPSIRACKEASVSSCIVDGRFLPKFVIQWTGGLFKILRSAQALLLSNQHSHSCCIIWQPRMPILWDHSSPLYSPVSQRSDMLCYP